MDHGGTETKDNLWLHKEENRQNAEDIQMKKGWEAAPHVRGSQGQGEQKEYKDSTRVTTEDDEAMMITHP
jgi:hypothetical protein